MHSTLTELEFAVADVETTGLFPGGADRIVEIAILRMDGGGNQIGEYASLVNPQRDIGPTHIHGITAQQALRAPTFENIAGDVREMLAGAIFVAHNARFDYRFIWTAFERLGYDTPNTPRLCTMNLAMLMEPELPSKKLQACCRTFGIPLTDAHCAYNDAEAAAHILARFLAAPSSDHVAELQHLGREGTLPSANEWPALSATKSPVTRSDADIRIDSEPSYIAQLVAKVEPACSGDETYDEYLALLDRVLEDRRVTENEAQALSELAQDLNITRQQMVSAHEQYMAELIRLALADGRISEAEKTDLLSVRALLGIGKDRFRECFAEVKREVSQRGPTKNNDISHAQQLAGKAICFTGTFSSIVDGESASRELAMKLAAERGMTIKKGVSKKLDYLVTADPDSQSGKAKKAREYGIRIIAEPVFWQLMGIDVE